MALCMSSYSHEHLCVYQEITASRVSGWVSPLAAMGSQNKDAEPLQTVETAPGGWSVTAEHPSFSEFQVPVSVLEFLRELPAPWCQTGRLADHFC